MPKIPENAEIQSWFPRFIERLIARSRKGENFWPALDTENGREFWIDLMRSIHRTGATEEVADEASSRVCDAAGDLFLNQFRTQLLAEIHSEFARLNASNAAGQAAPTTLEQASKACKNSGCPCGGTGMIRLYVHSDLVQSLKFGAYDRPARLGDSFVMVNSCVYGLEIEKNNKTASRDTKSPIMMPGQFPALVNDPRYRHHPNDWDAMHGCVLPPSDQDLALIEAMITDIRLRSGPVQSATEKPSKWSRANWVNQEIRDDAAEQRALINRQFTQTQTAQQQTLLPEEYEG